MPKLAELTDDQFKDLLNGYFAPPEKRSMMTQTEVKELAERLNGKINAPIINETHEEKILIKVVIKIDQFLYDNIPNEFYDLVRSVDKGISDEEAARLIARLAKLANERIDIPYIPEAAEHIAISFIIGVIINSARTQWDFNKAKNATEQELEAVMVNAG